MVNEREPKSALGRIEFFFPFKVGTMDIPKGKRNEVNQNR